MTARVEAEALVLAPAAIRAPARFRPRKLVSNALWYLLLTSFAVVTVFPFFWMLMTSLKGPADAIVSVPPQFIPSDPTLDNYARVLKQLPIVSFFTNSIVASVALTLLNTLVAALAAY